MTSNILRTFLSFLPAVILMNSCVSTDLVEPSDEAASTAKEIVLNLSAPAEAATRADNGYKLRYVATIYRGKNANSWGNALDRREIIDGENSNRIVFQVDPKDDYAILVFADYIPKDTEPGANGRYADYFYNTNRMEKTVYIRTTPGSDKTTVSPDFFNNPNYDAFFGQRQLYKDEAEVTVNLTLKRVTAQVVFRDNSEETGDCGIVVNKLGYRNMYTLDNSMSSDPVGADNNLGNIALQQTATIDSQNKDLFYFYTLADLQTGQRYVSTQFKISKDGNETDPYSVMEIPVKSNYRTIVSGKFVPEDTSTSPPIEDPSTKVGDIILNLSTDLQWEQQELSK